MPKTPGLIAFMIGLVAGGLATWIRPYHEILILGMDYRTIMAVAVLVFSFLYKLLENPPTRKTALFLALGATAGFAIRIIYDVTVISVSRPDWLLEIVLFALIAFFSAFLGTYLGELLTWTKRNKSP